MRNSKIEVRPISGSIGAEIHNVDIGTTLTDETVADIRKALNEHCVIFFRNQKLDVAQHKAFVRRFGEIFIHPNFKGTQADPEVVNINRMPGDTYIVGEEWHTDTTMMPAPPMGAILYGMEIPPYGGDTLFSSQWLAYESLSDGMKRLLKGLRAIHSDRRVAGPLVGKARNAMAATKVREDDAWRETATAHPVVCRHPESGRRHLFINATYTVGFEGMTEEESAPLLRYLLEQGHRPEFTCRFRWRPGSVAFWDNRATKHVAVHDAGRFLRIMRRVQIEGQPPIEAD